MLFYLIARLASDLLLWEPMAPSPTDRPDPFSFSVSPGLDLASQMLRAQGPDRFVMCRSGLRSYDDGRAKLALAWHGSFITTCKVPFMLRIVENGKY